LKDINYKELEQFISIPRLKSYEQIVKKKSVEHLIAAYLWNKQVSAALYPIIQCLEITLRNALHIVASQAFTSNDWYEKAVKNGGDKKFKSLYPTGSEQYFRKSAGFKKVSNQKPWRSNHENMLKNAKSQLERNNKLISSSNVISTLMFGFWVSFFEDAYAGIDSKKSLWPHLENKLFLNGPILDRKSAHRLLLDLQVLRNRLSHHEPIWKDKSVHNDNTAIQFLLNQVENALLLIRALSIERHRHLLRSGKVTYFKGLCSKQTLLAYLREEQFKRLDKRKIKKLVCREIRNTRQEPMIINIDSVPRFIIDLWPK